MPVPRGYRTMTAQAGVDKRGCRKARKWVTLPRLRQYILKGLRKQGHRSQSAPVSGNTIPKQMKLSLAYDRGKEMAEHTLFIADTKMKVCFVHPRTHGSMPLQNDNIDGPMRQHCPKGTIT